MISVLVAMLAGLGLFLTGVKILQTNMYTMTSRKFRTLLEKVTDSDIKGSLLGIIFGAITISTTAVNYAVIGMLSTGLLSVQRALPIINWAGAGSLLLLVIVFMDINQVMLFLLGITGILYAFDKPKNKINLVAAALGLCIIFIGIKLMIDSANPLKDMEWFKELILYSKKSYFLAFLIGAVLSFVIQSVDAFLIVIFSFAKVGIFDADDTIVYIYASIIGEGLRYCFLALGLKGQAKQLALFPAVSCIIGLVIFIPLYFIEVKMNIPLVKHLFVSTNSFPLEQQMTYFLVFFSLVTTFLSHIFIKPVISFLEKLWPATLQEQESSLKYVKSDILNDTVSAIAIIEKEQYYILQKLPLYTEIIRNKLENTPSKYEIEPLNNVVTKLTKELDFYISELINKNLDKETSQQYLKCVHRHNLMCSIFETIAGFTNDITNVEISSEMEKLVRNFLEGLDAILLTANDVFTNFNSEDIAMLKSMTADKSDLMNRFRDKYLGLQPALKDNEKKVLLIATEHFEKIIWLLKKIVELN
ncbi:Na/Pi cotransporter family protein [Candidatus Dependentiae bacterium]|nr:Na/Pi cotransporter family protein [Candidatus Dependentiae bacterium]